MQLLLTINIQADALERDMEWMPPHKPSIFPNNDPRQINSAGDHLPGAIASVMTSAAAVP